MIEATYTATDFRHQFTRFSEAAGFYGARVVMRRHGHDIAALVGPDDLEFLRKHRPFRTQAAVLYPPEYMVPPSRPDAVGWPPPPPPTSPTPLTSSPPPPQGSSSQRAPANDGGPLRVPVAEERERQRKEKEERRRREREKVKEEKRAAEHAAWKRRFMLNHSPGALDRNEVRKFYVENANDPDSAVQLWRAFAWRVFVAEGQSEGLDPPGPLAPQLPPLGLPRPSA